MPRKILESGLFIGCTGSYKKIADMLGAFCLDFQKETKNCLTPLTHIIQPDTFERAGMSCL
jgi:hypothetical protein